jgi:formamidopyrimidine-DNA glycosylase
MHGILDILRNTNDAGDIQRYQVRYEDLAGNSFIGSMDEQELHDLLYHKLPMSIGDAELDSSYERLKEKGRITMKTLDLDQNALAGAGLEYLPAEG